MVRACDTSWLMRHEQTSVTLTGKRCKRHRCRKSELMPPAGKCGKSRLMPTAVVVGVARADSCDIIWLVQHDLAAGNGDGLTGLVFLLDYV